MAESSSSSTFDRDVAVKELRENGFTVIPNVLTHAECDRHIEEYKKWFSKFDDQGTRLKSRNSIIQSYRIGHFKPTWEVRIACKDVFAKVWNTEKLLTSADAVAISKPPEQGSDEFTQFGEDFLHLDQSVKREGLHAYQGGAYLEESTNTDHCFRVLSHSHKYHSEFFQTFPTAADKSRRLEFLKLTKKQKEWYAKRGCVQTKVPVPKGGIVLWDSRTVHDNCKPEYGREHSDRWRFVVFVSMTPAKWTGPDDLAKKAEAYEKLLITSHWSSQGLKTFTPFSGKKNNADLTISTQPDVAKTMEAKQLFGIVPYNFSDGKPNGPEPPTWIP